jgi:hypothetical protein
MRELLQTTGGLIMMLLAATLFMFSATVALTPLSIYSCNKLADLHNTEGQYGFWTGCHIKIDNKWVHKDHLRYEQRD